MKYIVLILLTSVLMLTNGFSQGKNQNFILDHEKLAPYTVSIQDADIDLGAFVQGFSRAIFPPNNTITFVITKTGKNKHYDIMFNNSQSKTGNHNDVKLTAEWTINNGRSQEELKNGHSYRLYDYIYITVTINQIDVAKGARPGRRDFMQCLDVEIDF